jgi:hypothetical protein
VQQMRRNIPWSYLILATAGSGRSTEGRKAH